MRKRIYVIAFATAALSACASAPTMHVTKKKSGDTVAQKDGAYHIGPEDKVNVVVWHNPDLSGVVPVRPDGKISVPLIGDVQAAGLTPMEVASNVKNKLSYYIREPNVSVIVTDMKSADYQSRVRVTGAVRTPISVPYQPGMTVLDAVLQAGGPNDFAAPNRTKLLRRERNKVETIPIKLGSILNSGGMATNVEVKPGDIITVPERLF